MNLENLKSILNKMKTEGSLSGTILSFKDGTLLYENVGRNIDFKEFTPMCASVLKSAIGIGKTIGERKIVKIIAELEDQTIMIIECDEKVFLTLIIEENSKIEPILKNLSDYISDIVKNY